MKKISIISLILLSLCCLQCKQKSKSLVILHTNDMHSQIEPIDVSKNKGLGGMVRIAAIVNEERNKNPHLFLFDAGDFWQGTPYFNFHGGKIEIAMMNAIGYDAGTLGNHEFDLPVDTLSERLKEANYPIVLCNYDISQTALRDVVEPYVIIEKGGVKVGVLGLCIDLENLAFAQNCIGMIYQDPIESANKTAAILKEKGCEFIVCLSHLGYNDNPGADDIAIAQNTQNIDLIIGGHSHIFLEKSDIQTNLNGKPVTIVQMGKSGAHIGKVEVNF